MKIFILGLLTLIFAAQCNTKSSYDKANGPIKQSMKNSVTTGAGTITEQFITGHELVTQYLVQLGVIDTSGTGRLSEMSYCDTTLQLNDSVSYSIISANDEAGICTYFVVASYDNQNGKLIASKFLHADCDVDYSKGTYALNEHSIISKDKIEVITTIVVQKKNRTSANEEENIGEKQRQKKSLRFQKMVE